MLWDFSYDAGNVYICFSRWRPDGCHASTNRILRRGQSFRGLTYAQLKAAGDGVIYTAHTDQAEILKSDDPRLHPAPTGTAFVLGPSRR